MNKRDRIEQRRIAMKAIRTELRTYAKAKRERLTVEHGSRAHEDASRRESLAFDRALGMRALAADLGILPYFTSGLNERTDRIIYAPVTRRPFRHLKAVSA